MRMKFNEIEYKNLTSNQIKSKPNICSNNDNDSFGLFVFALFCLFACEFAIYIQIELPVEVT